MKAIHGTVASIIERHGHEVALVKRDIRIPCPCRDELRQESSCERCMGTGYKIELSKAMAYRKRNAQGPMPDTRKDDAGGSSDHRSYAFFVAGATIVSSGDLVVERIEGSYDVHVITTCDLHQDGERVVYSSIFTRRRNV